MLKFFNKSNFNPCHHKFINNGIFGGSNQIDKTIHNTSITKYPQVAALKLPTNVVNINESEMSRFSPLRERDLAGPAIDIKHDKQVFDITLQRDPHVNKYDSRGAVNLSSSMQSNVPSPFSGNHTHLNMPGSQWGQGYKYLSNHLQNAHYLSLRNEYRGKLLNKGVYPYVQKIVFSFLTFKVINGFIALLVLMVILIPLCIFFQSIVITIGARNNCTQKEPPLSAKEKLKKAVKDYGSTVVVFHVTISLLSLGGCYILVSSGVDIMAILKYLNIGEGALSNAVTSNAGTFVIAYGVHKIFAPVRIALTLTATPFIVRYLRRIGFLRRNNGSGGGK